MPARQRPAPYKRGNRDAEGVQRLRGGLATKSEAGPLRR
jgi:hypothetical protein